MWFGLVFNKWPMNFLLIWANRLSKPTVDRLLISYSSFFSGTFNCRLRFLRAPVCLRNGLLLWSLNIGSSRVSFFFCRKSCGSCDSSFNLSLLSFNYPSDNRNWIGVCGGVFVLLWFYFFSFFFEILILGHANEDDIRVPRSIACRTRLARISM